MDKSLKTSAIEDLNLASKILAETVPMTTNDRIILALVEHALVKLESSEVFTPLMASRFSGEWGSVIYRFSRNLDYKIKNGIEYTAEFVGVRGDFEVYKVSQLDGLHPDGYCLYSLKHKEYSENIYATDFGCLEDEERYFAFLPVKNLKPDYGLKETSLPPHKRLVKPWPVDVRGPMVRVPNLTEELKHGTKYRGVVHATEGQMHIFQITNRENQSEPAKYVLYSVEHGICSDWLHVSPEAAWADMDYFLRAVVSKVKKPENEKDSGQAEPDNLEHNKSETKSFVNLAMHLKLNKFNYVKDLVETATLNGETGRIYSVKVKNSGEEWFAVERLSDGESYLCNVMYRTKLGALDAFYAHAKNNAAQQVTEELPESSVTDETDTIEFTDLKKSLKLYSHAWKIIGTEEMDKPYKDRLIFTIKRVETEDLWYVGGESSDDGRKIELLNTIHKTKDRAVMAFYSQKGLKHPEEDSTK